MYLECMSIQVLGSQRNSKKSNVYHQLLHAFIDLTLREQEARMALAVLKLFPDGGSIVLHAYESAILRRFPLLFLFENKQTNKQFVCLVFCPTERDKLTVPCIWSSVLYETKFTVPCFWSSGLCETKLQAHLPPPWLIFSYMLNQPLHVIYHQAFQVTLNSLLYPVRQIVCEMKSLQLTTYPIVHLYFYYSYGIVDNALSNDLRRGRQLTFLELLCKLWSLHKV